MINTKEKIAKLKEMCNSRNGICEGCIFYENHPCRFDGDLEDDDFCMKIDILYQEIEM